jgi:hypothetical protein
MRRPRKKGSTGTASDSTSGSPVAMMPEQRETSNTTHREPENQTPQSVGDTTVGASDRERIATRAYEIYLARGGTGGYELDDWLAAERELSAASLDRDSG